MVSTQIYIQRSWFILCLAVSIAHLMLQNTLETPCTRTYWQIVQIELECCCLVFESWTWINWPLECCCIWSFSAFSDNTSCNCISLTSWLLLLPHHSIFYWQVQNIITLLIFIQFLVLNPPCQNHLFSSLWKHIKQHQKLVIKQKYINKINYFIFSIFLLFGHVRLRTKPVVVIRILYHFYYRLLNYPVISLNVINSWGRWWWQGFEAPNLSRVCGRDIFSHSCFILQMEIYDYCCCLL